MGLYSGALYGGTRHSFPRGEFMKHRIGIDAGSVSINAVVTDIDGNLVFEAPYTRHYGRVRETTAGLIRGLFEQFGADTVASVSFTGVHGQRLAQILSAPFEVETIAQVLGVMQIAPGTRTIVSMGGQDASLLVIAASGDSWRLEHFSMNGPCASGTGSFIDQQAERLAGSLGTSGEGAFQTQQILDDFIALGLSSDNPAPVACRCTVFTKSDMIHLQNKGEPLANIIAGLHAGNAANYVSTVAAGRGLVEPAVLVGGMAGNALQVKAFKEHCPGITVPPHHAALGALGMAILAAQQGRANRIDLSLIEGDPLAADELPRGERLTLSLSPFDPDNELDPYDHSGGPVDAFLGVDVGSTTTKYALLDVQGRILHKRYVPTQGKPVEVARRLVAELREEMGGKVRLRAIATTGSGRHVVGDFLRADLAIDEITAHARAAVAVDPEVDTLFEIGGQDSKYVRIEGTHPLDFDMNKVCAAGTGSFLAELAAKLGIEIAGEFQEIALRSASPVHLAERCTVFMESDLMSSLQRGATRDDVIAGLCYAVVHNYLNRVVGKRRIGRRIMFLGGPSLNKGVVAAFEKILGRRIATPKHREVMGAWGAALTAIEAFSRGETGGDGHDMEALGRAEAVFSETICHADGRCHNECKLKVYDFAGRKTIWGGDCGRYEIGGKRTAKKVDLFKARRDLFVEALENRAAILDDRRPSTSTGPTVGIPWALHTHEWGVFWVHLLAGLGFAPLLSPRTDGKIVTDGVTTVTAEACFPVKVFHGHAKALADRTDFLFLPNVITMPTPAPGETGLLCPFVQSSQYMASASLGLQNDKTIRPTLRLKEGPEGIEEAVREALPARLRPSRAAVAEAIGTAWKKQQAFRDRCFALGREALAAAAAAGEPVWVVTGRPYNLHDERLSLSLGRQVASLGVVAIPMDLLDVDGEDLSDFPRMYWGLGARILRAARLISREPELFGLHLTNFGCGADSFIEHFYQHILGEKPSLILELDEHSAAGGVLTRLEAFRNVVGNVRRGTQAEVTP
jgi:predicted CoA-substrate-specific enzyme activase